jgi:hypothetical protein
MYEAEIISYVIYEAVGAGDRLSGRNEQVRTFGDVSEMQD